MVMSVVEERLGDWDVAEVVEAFGLLEEEWWLVLLGDWCGT